MNTLDRFPIAFNVPATSPPQQTEEVWKERQDAITALKVYLTDMPSKEIFWTSWMISSFSSNLGVCSWPSREWKDQNVTNRSETI